MEEEEEETDAITETMVNDYNVSDASQSTTTSTSAPLNPSSFDYFDRLRRQPNVQASRDLSSSILQVTEPDTNQVYRLAELKCFLPLTENGNTIRPLALDDAFTVLLAMDHFNHAMERSPGIVAAHKGEMAKQCNVRLTTEIIDTEFSTVAATYSYVNLLPTQRQDEETIFGVGTAAVQHDNNDR